MAVPVCPCCGYDLSGIHEPGRWVRCPECGRTFGPQESLRRPRSLGLAILAGASPWAAFWVAMFLLPSWVLPERMAGSVLPAAGVTAACSLGLSALVAWRGWRYRMANRWAILITFEVATGALMVCGAWVWAFLLAAAGC